MICCSWYSSTELYFFLLPNHFSKFFLYFYVIILVEIFIAFFVGLRWRAFLRPYGIWKIY